MVSRDGLVRDAYESELPRVLGMVAAIWQLAFGIQVVGYLHEYREPLVPLVVWAGLIATARWLVPHTGKGELSGRDSAAAIAIAVAAVSLCAWAGRSPGGVESVDWSVFGTSWLLAIVAVSRPAWEWACGAVLVFGAHLVFSAHLLGTLTLGLTRLSASAYALTAIGIIFAALRPTLRAQARIAVHRAELSSRSAAERDAVEAIREDRRARLALLEAEALPLLRGIADGTLDPTNSDVRERCARHAATLRRSLTGEQLDTRSELKSRLEPALRAANARALLVDVQEIGDPGDPGPAVAAATITAVESVLSQLPPHPVTLTLLASSDDVELYVTFSERPRNVPDVDRAGQDVPASAQWHACVDIDETGAGCLEVGWRKVAA